MRLVSHERATDLRIAVSEHLAADEAMNNHFFGILGSAAAGAYDGGDNLWLSAHDDDAVVGCAFRTAPWPLAISFGTPPEAAALLAQRAAEHYPDGFDLNLAPHLADAISKELGWDLEETLGQGIYELDEVRFPAGTPGTMRLATEWDVDLAAAWGLGFQRDSHGDMSRTLNELRKMIRSFVAANSLVLWEVDGVAVSMAAARGPTPRGIRISFVYTPPEHRRRGYASACVATLSQRQLDAGREFCFLFTELANATSNHIYQSIGYRRVGELSRYRSAEP